MDGHRLYIHPKLINRAKVYYDWMPEWYKLEILDKSKVQLLEGWGPKEYIAIIIAAYNRNSTTKETNPNFIKYREGETLSPKQEKTNWLVRIFNDLYPHKSIPYNDRSPKGDSKTQYIGWGNASCAGGFGGVGKFDKLMTFVSCLEEQNWSFLIAEREPGITSFTTKNSKFGQLFITDDLSLKEFSIIASIDNPVYFERKLQVPPPHLNVYKLGRFTNFLNSDYSKRRTLTKLFDEHYNPSLHKQEYLLSRLKIDMPFLFLKTNNQIGSQGYINYTLRDPLLKSRLYLEEIKREEEKIQRNKELHKQVIKLYNTRNINKYYKYVQKSLRYSLDYINKDSTFSIKKRDYTKPGTYFNIGLLLDAHNYVINNLETIRNTPDEGGGHLESGNRYHTITLVDIIDYFFTFSTSKEKHIATNEIEGLVWNYIKNNIPRQDWCPTPAGRCKPTVYNILLNWCAPIDKFIKSKDSTAKLIRISNKAIGGSKQWLITKSNDKTSTVTTWKMPSMLFIRYE